MLRSLRRYTTVPTKPLISINNATFRGLPSTTPTENDNWFPGLSFTLPSPSVHATPQKWAVLGSSRQRFLEILQGKHICEPPESRTYPLLASRGKWPHQAIELVSFGAGGSGSGMLGGGTGGDGYLSARYETLREEFDLTLKEWLAEGVIKGRTVTAWEEGGDGEEAGRLTALEEEMVGNVVEMLRLDMLVGQSVMTLSNGQSRRARVAKALLKRSDVLLLDEPFMGLDPPSRTLLSELLSTISNPKSSTTSLTTQVLLGLRPQDPVPSWSTHLAFVESNRVRAIGDKSSVIDALKSQGIRIVLEGSEDHHGLLDKVWAGIGDGAKAVPAQGKEEEGGKEEMKGGKEGELAKPLVEMKDVRIKYYDKEILNNFSWTIRRGEKWGLFGPNGSGKTTLISLITSDHPQTYSLPIKHFGKTRLPTLGTPGISVFDIQARIGYSSPEVHAFFPKRLSLSRTVLSSFAETFLSTPRPTPEQLSHAESLMLTFAEFLPRGASWEETFGAVDISTQRMALFLRAIVKRPELIVLDEAFSGMQEEVRGRCFEVLEREFDPKRQAMVVVSHVTEEIPPGVGRWVRLAERGSGGKAGWGIVE
ncbi:hypothetical protein RUND412_000003 [Rhizina undulata]